MEQGKVHGGPDLETSEKASEFPGGEWGRILGAASTTVEPWEPGECTAVGMHHRLLI
jgi:hypothetical protein